MSPETLPMTAPPAGSPFNGRDMPELMTPPQVAQLLGVNVTTLRNWRHAGAGPRFVTLSSRTIRYRLADVRAFIDRNTSSDADGTSSQHKVATP